MPGEEFRYPGQSKSTEFGGQLSAGPGHQATFPDPQLRRVSQLGEGAETGGESLS